MEIRKAVFPVAGLGTRFLPATKGGPKEMFPIVDKPVIQYAVEEAIKAGITHFIFVTNDARQQAIENYFSRNAKLETNLIEVGKNELLQVVRNILPAGVTCQYVQQHAPLGLGHAVLCAKELIGNEPFAVLLADDLIDCAKQSCLQQMLGAFKKHHTSVVAVQKILPKDSYKYGIVDLAQRDQALSKIRGIVEKPSPEKAPSDLAVVGRYILTPEIFFLLERTLKGSGGEIQLTDAIASLLVDQSVYSLQFQGRRYDCGSKLGYLEATLAFAVKHPELGSDFKKCLQSFMENMMLDNPDVSAVEERVSAYRPGRF